MICSSDKNWIRTLILIVAVIFAVSGARAQGVPPVVASAAYSIPSTGLTTPASAVVDSCGNVYVMDSSNGNVYEVPSGGGTATQVASSGSGGTTSLAIDAGRNNLFVIRRWNVGANEIPIVGCVLQSSSTQVGNNYGSLSWWYDAAAVATDAAGEYRLLGGTIDDAAGEAFDKVGKLLGLKRTNATAATKPTSRPAAGEPTLTDRIADGLRNRGNRPWEFSDIMDEFGINLRALKTSLRHAGKRFQLAGNTALVLVAPEKVCTPVLAV